MMKHIKFKHILSIFLTVVMLAACITCLVLPAYAAEVSVQNGTGTRGDIHVDTTLAYRAKVNGEFTGFPWLCLHI